MITAVTMEAVWMVHLRLPALPVGRLVRLPREPPLHQPPVPRRRLLVRRAARRRRDHRPHAHLLARQPVVVLRVVPGVGHARPERRAAAGLAQQGAEERLVGAAAGVATAARIRWLAVATARL